MAQNDTWDADPSVNLSISLYCVLCAKHHPVCCQCYICNQFICEKCQRFRGEKIKKKEYKTPRLNTWHETPFFNM